MGGLFLEKKKSMEKFRFRFKELLCDTHLYKSTLKVMSQHSLCLRHLLLNCLDDVLCLFLDK